MIKFAGELFKISLDAMCGISDGGQFLDINPAFTQILGWTQADLTNTPFLGLIHPDDQDQTRAAAVQMRTQGGSIRYENRVRHKDGTYRVFAWAIAWSDEHHYAFASGRDLTHERRNTNLLQTLFQSMYEGMVVQNAQGEIVNVNPAAEAILGQKMSALKGAVSIDPNQSAVREDGSPIPPAELPNVLALAHGVPQGPMVMGIRNSEGRRRWISVSAVPVVSPDSLSREYVLSTFTDVTARRENERLVQESNRAVLNEKRKFETFVLGLNKAAAVSLGDENGNIIYVNEKFCEISEYSAEELIGKNFRLLNSKFHPAQMFLELYTTIRSGRVWSREICNRKKSGERFWVDSTLIPIMGEGGKVDQCIAIQFDISSRKAAEHNLVHTAKMASLGEMAGGVAHEINNPLAIINLKIDRLRRLIANPDVAKAEMIPDIDKIATTTDRITRIVRGLRTFSRSADADPFQLTPVAVIVNETLGLCVERFKHGGVEVQVGEVPDVSLECRPTQISQVLLNLLNNAFDAIEARPDKWIRLDFKTDEHQHLSISVTDCGPGIPAEIADQLMSPFFTTKEVGKGTGLGLSIAKGIMETHGGRLILDRECRNTRFLMEIPFKIANPSGNAA